MTTAMQGLMVNKHRNSKGQTLQEKADLTGTQTQWISAVTICRSNWGKYETRISITKVKN